MMIAEVISKIFDNILAFKFTILGCQTLTNKRVGFAIKCNEKTWIHLTINLETLHVFLSWPLVYVVLL